MEWRIPSQCIYEVYRLLSLNLARNIRDDILQIHDYLEDFDVFLAVGIVRITSDKSVC